MTNSQRMRDSAVVMSSTIPSAKYSCSGSPLMFWNGRTAIDGLSGSGSGGRSGRAEADAEHPDLCRNVLQRGLAEVVDLQRHLAGGVLPHTG